MFCLIMGTPGIRRSSRSCDCPLRHHLPDSPLPVLLWPLLTSVFWCVFECLAFCNVAQHNTCKLLHADLLFPRCDLGKRQKSSFTHRRCDVFCSAVCLLPFPLPFSSLRLPFQISTFSIFRQWSKKSRTNGNTQDSWPRSFLGPGRPVFSSCSVSPTCFVISTSRVILTIAVLDQSGFKSLWSQVMVESPLASFQPGRLRLGVRSVSELSGQLEAFRMCSIDTSCSPT